jgi:tetratricopeptide (TPR) repeat protein
MALRTTAALAALVTLAACGAPSASSPKAAAARPAAKVTRDPAADAQAARKARDFARAEAIADGEIAAGRGTARLFFERGVARMELGRREEALADLRRVNELQEDAAALLLAGSVELQLARWEDAERTFARLVEIAPANARAWASLAQARIARRDLAGASAAHGEAAALAPADPYVREVGDRLALATATPTSNPNPTSDPNPTSTSTETPLASERAPAAKP